MPAAYARGKYALAICDRCGCRTRYLELRNQIVNSAPTGLKVCPDCLDQDHPQLKLNKVRIYDPQGLRQPRGEIDIVDQRKLFGMVLGVTAQGGVGRLTATVS